MKARTMISIPLQHNFYHQRYVQIHRNNLIPSDNGTVPICTCLHSVALQSSLKIIWSKTHSNTRLLHKRFSKLKSVSHFHLKIHAIITRHEYIKYSRGIKSYASFLNCLNCFLVTITFPFLP